MPLVSSSEILRQPGSFLLINIKLVDCVFGEYPNNFNSTINNINKTMHRFSEYSFFLTVPDLKCNRNKYPGTFYLSWTLSPTWKESDPVVGPASTSNGALHFTQEVSLVTKLIFNKQDQQFHKKKSVLHILYKANDKPEAKMAKFGTVTINLEELSGEEHFEQNDSVLENTHNKTARISFNVKVVKEKDTESMERSATGSIDSKIGRDKERSESPLINTALKVAKRTPLDRSKTAEKPFKNLMLEATPPKESAAEEQKAGGLFSQFRSEREIREGLNKELNDEKQQNIAMTKRISQLEEVIRMSQQTDETDQNIYRLEKELAKTKGFYDSSKENLREATDSLSKMKSKVQLLELENKQLQSEVETKSRMGKRVSFRIEEDTFLEDVKEELKNEKYKVEDLEDALAQKQEDYQSLTSQNKKLMEEIDRLAAQLNTQRQEATRYRLKYQHYKLTKHTKKKEREKAYNLNTAYLTGEIMRLHQQLYEIRSVAKEDSSDNKEIQRLLTLKSQYDNIKETFTSMFQNNEEKELLKILKQKTHNLKQKQKQKQEQGGLEKLKSEIKPIQLLLTELKSLNVKMTSTNEKKMLLLVKDIEGRLEGMFT